MADEIRKWGTQAQQGPSAPDEIGLFVQSHVDAAAPTRVIKYAPGYEGTPIPEPVIPPVTPMRIVKYAPGHEGDPIPDGPTPPAAGTPTIITKRNPNY